MAALKSGAVRGVWLSVVGAACLGAWTTVAIGATSAGATSVPAATLAACDAPSHQQVLVPAAAPALPAQAYWLDRSRIQWPGVQASAGSRWRLVSSAQAQLKLQPGGAVQGVDASVRLTPDASTLPPEVAERFKFVPAGVRLRASLADQARLPALWRSQVWLLEESAQGQVLRATALQLPGALDDRYAAAEQVPELGVVPAAGRTTFRVWAPTAQSVSACVYPDGRQKASALLAAKMDAATGIWQAREGRDLQGASTTWLVDVVVPGVGLVRNRVTDPYAFSVNTDSRRTYITRADAPALQPEGWRTDRAPATVKAPTDMSVYELHVRDFSATDDSVPAAHRGKYLAFTQGDSRGMRHLRALAAAGMTDVHLLPVYDIGSVPERGCAVPQPAGAPDATSQQAAVQAVKEEDCFNWGYDPFHYNAPEGSYATDPDDGAVRVRELRQMVMALHRAGLRVGMDVVYNHTFAAGQHEKSVLDRIVPGYYHRLNGEGVIERSTCCDNTATEHRMMGRLMSDSVLLWARDHHIDSFRFDLMGHQPRAAMVAMQARLKRELGRDVPFIGEGWNFGEVANGARFVQASQLSLNGTGIGTFSDRARDAVRGGGAGDGGVAMIARQGYVNGQHYDPNDRAAPATMADLMRTADLVRVGLAGALRDYRMTTWDGTVKPLSQIDYAGQPAGYASQPAEVVSYVENHDNQTLFDNNVMKLPRGTSRHDRARVQALASAINAFSQGVAYFHAGQDILRSKSLDRNSFNSGDWFNRLDWSYQTNHFGTGLPSADDNRNDWPLMQPLLADPGIAPTPADIAFARDAFRDLLAIRASSTLFRLRTADEVQRRLRFLNVGPSQQATVLVGQLDGAGLPLETGGGAGAGFEQLVYVINVDQQTQRLALPALAGLPWQLHPVHLAAGAADARAREAVLDNTGQLSVPARTAVVFVLKR
ncbi:MAG: alpha-1,6-glucosidase [Burkholderiales bacterium PBB6]|nr:MAG: alpha-1,6-glucosidase [Burkholderiales bacterium PBB6]